MKKLLPILIIIFLLGAGLAGSFLIFRKEKPTEVKKGEGEVKLEISGKKILIVLAPKDFRDEEYLEPRKILEEAGAEIIVSSKGTKEARGVFGATATVDKDIGEVNASDYEAIVFVGGPGSSVYFDDQTALNLARDVFGSGKVVAAICIAPSILANAGILSGKKATAFSSEKDNLEAKGAQYTGEPVTVDGKIITARGPEAAQEFGKKLVEALQ